MNYLKIIFKSIFNIIDYYRVTYDTVNYGLIRDQLVADHLKISDNNRAQLLDDSFVLASVNLVPYAQALDLTLYLRNEREYVPWDAVTDELIYIDGMLFKTSQYADWKVRALKIIFNACEFEHINCNHRDTWRLK